MTSYDEVIDLALISIQDYRLNKLAIEHEEEFKIVLEGFLMRAIPHFDNCIKDLSDRDDTLKQFNIELDDDEKEILADWIVIMWLDKEIADTRQITAMLQNNKEAHRYSEANLLSSKQNYRVQKREDVGQRQTAYGYRHNKWREWAGGNYDL